MDVQQRSLAVEIWRGRNGGRQPQRLGGAGNWLSQSYSQVENVPFDVLKRVREFKYEGSEQRDYPLIQAFGDRILVHPATTRPTLAYIPQRLPPGVRSVRIQCETRHKLASDIEYAMAIVSSAEGVSALFEGNAGAADGFSGWRRLQALEVQWLALTLSEPVKSPHYIFWERGCRRSRVRLMAGRPGVNCNMCMAKALHSTTLLKNRAMGQSNRPFQKLKWMLRLPLLRQRL